MGDLGDTLDVEDIDLGVAHDLGVEALGLVGDRAPPGVEVRGIDEAGVDSQLAKADVELLEGAAVEGRGGDELVAGLHQREEGDELSRLAGRGGEGADPVLERRHPLLEDGDGRVHDPRVDIPEALQREEVGSVVGVLENVGAGLVDGHRARTGHRVRALPGMHRESVEPELLRSAFFSHIAEFSPATAAAPHPNLLRTFARP